MKNHKSKFIRSKTMMAVAGFILILSPHLFGNQEADISKSEKDSQVADRAWAELDLRTEALPPHAIWLDKLDLLYVIQDRGKPRSGQSVDRRKIRINDVFYPRGLGTHANSELHIALDGCATRFVSMVGLDDEKKGGSVRFIVMVDGRRAAQTDIIRPRKAAQRISVDLTGAKRMALLVDKGDDDNEGDHADWAGAMIFLAPDAKSKPRAISGATGEPTMPIAHGVSPEPRINNPHIVGTTPGRPFTFLVPATGEGPLDYSSQNLPTGLSLDSKTGIVTGSLEKPGEYHPTITVKGPRGQDTRELTILGGKHMLARTPPMGWNSWNVWARSVDDAKVRAAADAMVESGLAAHGFQYVNIDDCWEARRDANGEIQANDKFPDMKTLGGYIHARGLRFGIYSSPGPRTCAGYEGSFQHEEQDVRTWCKWGVDYLKYDWCTYGQGEYHIRDASMSQLQEPYRLMRTVLDHAGRDIVYSMCQYGRGRVWTWGTEVGGNLWRTWKDISDDWQSLCYIAAFESGHSKYASPGHWNDPDMLVVGKLGWGPNIHETGLLPNEQITHITLWSLLAAPLLLGCDMSQLDAFTLDLLCNDEVLDVNQDILGQAAECKVRNDTTDVWARRLADGTMAVGLFNRGSKTAMMTVRWSDVGITGKQPVRDLWLHKNVGTYQGSYTHQVYAHGAALVKIGAPSVR